MAEGNMEEEPWLVILRGCHTASDTYLQTSDYEAGKKSPIF
jgi:hypothetical protein